MDEAIKKKAIVQAMSEIECYPIIQEDTDVQEYTKVPLGQISAMGAIFASVAPALQNAVQNMTTSGVGEKLYKMIVPNGIQGTVNSVGNITNTSGTIIGRARFVEAGASTAGTVAQIDPTVLLMAVAITAVTKKLDQIEAAQKDIIEFLQLKEKAKLRGNIAVFQEIKRDAEQSIILCRSQIEKNVRKKGWLHSDQNVKAKIQKVQDEFKDYELAMYIFSFSSFLEVMLLENFGSEYLNTVTDKIQSYASKYHDLREECYQMIEGDSKTSIEAYTLKGFASLSNLLGKGIAKIPKISDTQMDEKFIELGDKVQNKSEKRTESTMEFFAHEQCTCVNPFIDNINMVNRIYNEPIELLFDNENIYFSLPERRVHSNFRNNSHP